MCGCTSNKTSTTGIDALPQDGIVLRVEDMSCGHCASTIKKTVEAGLPGTNVVADPGSKVVSVRGTTDLTAVTALVTEAGYTPSVPA